MRKFLLVGVTLTTAVVFLFPVFAWATEGGSTPPDDSGAVPTTTVDEGSNGSMAVYGECNIALEGAGTTAPTLFTGGVTIDMACQGEIPAYAAFVPDGPVIPQLASTQACGWQSGGGYTCGNPGGSSVAWGTWSSSGGGDSGEGDDLGYGRGCPWQAGYNSPALGGLDGTETNGSTEFMAWGSSLITNGVNLGVSCGEMDTVPPPSTYTFGSPDTLADYDNQEEIYEYEQGPAETATSGADAGQEYSAVQFRAEETLPEVASMSHPIFTPNSDPSSWSGNTTPTVEVTYGRVDDPCCGGANYVQGETTFGVNYMSVIPGWSGSYSTPAMPGEYYEGGGLDQTPCALLSPVTQPNTSTLQAGTSYSYTFDYTSADWIVVDPVDSSGSTVDPPSGFTDDDVTQLGNAPSDTQVYSDTVIVAATGAPQTVVVTPATAVPAGNVEFYLFCNGQSNPASNPVAGTNGLNSSGGFSLSGCLSQIDVGLDPSSWVPGLVSAIACVGQWAFVPSSASVQQFGSFFGFDGSWTESDAHPATEWVGGLTEMIGAWPTTAVSEIQTAADSGSCSLGSYPIGGQTFDMCSVFTDVSGNSTISTEWQVVDDIATAAFLVMISLAVFYLFRRMMSGAS